MNFIIDLDQHAMGLNEATDKPIDYTRQAARAVMRNGDGQIAIMHFTTTGSYKLPGGGIDEGEDTLTALHRELREETGYTVTDVAELGIVTENRYYCGMHQISYCYSAQVGDFVGTELTEKEQAEGMGSSRFQLQSRLAAAFSQHRADRRSQVQPPRQQNGRGYSGRPEAFHQGD